VYFRTDTQTGYSSTGEFEGDTLYMNLSLEYSSYSDALIPTGLFSAELYAFSCDYPVVNFLDEIVITSNNSFNQIPAGSSLNDKLMLASGQTIEEFLAGQDTGYYGYWNGYGLEFVWLEKPAEEAHTFQFTLTDNAGNIFTASAQPIVWK
jgi:hypothetical protein